MDRRREIFREMAHELHVFFKRVGKVWIYDELKFLDLEPNMLTGEFRRERVQSLIDFCAENTEYHIISCEGDKIFNKFMPEAHCYYLADRDADPDLLHDLCSQLSSEEFLQVGYTMFAPVLGKIKSGRDT